MPCSGFATTNYSSPRPLGGSAGTLRPIIMAKCGFGGARPPGEPPSMTQSCWMDNYFIGLRLLFGILYAYLKKPERLRNRQKT